jgi:hypothetical protein
MINGVSTVKDRRIQCWLEVVFRAYDLNSSPYKISMSSPGAERFSPGARFFCVPLRMWAADKVACYWDEVDPWWNIFLDGHFPMKAFIPAHSFRMFAWFWWLSANSCWLHQNKSWKLLYPLVMTNSSPWYRGPIEIDCLPNLKMMDLSMANC